MKVYHLSSANMRRHVLLIPLADHNLLEVHASVREGDISYAASEIYRGRLDARALQQLRDKGVSPGTISIEDEMAFVKKLSRDYVGACHDAFDGIILNKNGDKK